MNSDFISVRKDEIYNYVAMVGMATIQDISLALNISESTIRRDLKELEKEYKITSFHGGVSVNSGYDTFAARTIKNISQKKAIAAAAASLMKSHDVIYIGGGSTTFEFATALSLKKDLHNVSVITAAMNIAKCFVKNKNFKVIISGGEVESEDESMTSKYTTDFISGFNFDKSFIGSQAVSVQQGYTMPKYKLSELKKVVVQHSKELVLLVDHSKVGKVDSFNVCDISKVSTIVTNAYPENEEELSKMESRGVKVIRV